ncbi:MAG: hypothetical protein ACYC2G_13765 [Gemmatimonadaceae bacterium]
MSAAGITIAPASLQALATALVTTLGDDGAAHLRDAGFTTGEALAGQLRARQAERGAPPPEELTLPAFNAATAALLQSTGWGELTVDASRPAVTVLDANGWCESGAASAAPAVAAPGAHFTTGLLAGFFGTLAGEPLAVLEVEPDEPAPDRARFLMGSVETVNRLFGRLESGTPLSTVLAGT